MVRISPSVAVMSYGILMVLPNKTAGSLARRPCIVDAAAAAECIPLTWWFQRAAAWIIHPLPVKGTVQ